MNDQELMRHFKVNEDCLIVGLLRQTPAVKATVLEYVDISMMKDKENFFWHKPPLYLVQADFGRIGVCGENYLRKIDPPSDWNEFERATGLPRPTVKSVKEKENV